MSKPLKALLVEDNNNDAELLVLALEQGGFQVEYERVDTPQAYKTALDTKGWDVIFSDHSMPTFNSFYALNIRNEKGLDIPFFILSGTMGEDLAVEAMKAGASDYFVKGKLSRLVVAVNRELQETREHKVHRETEQELEHFVASLTHDLRTPILAEFRILELLESDAFGSLTAEQRDVIQELIQSNRFAQHMMNNILFAYKYKQKKVRLNQELTELAQYLQTLTACVTIQTLLKEKNKQLLTTSTGSFPPVYIDHNEIQRVVLNLIKNAIDYTPPGEPITLLVERQKEFLRVSIQDKGGLGVDPKVEPHLFTLYATSTAKQYHHVGMGLGLYLSKQIIEAHGGKIGYEKKADGSLFYFDLPILL